MGAICAKYDLDYWVWTPADFDLKDEAKRAAQLNKDAMIFARRSRGWMVCSSPVAIPATTIRR